jgi:hypothetical protein
VQQQAESTTFSFKGPPKDSACLYLTHRLVSFLHCIMAEVVALIASGVSIAQLSGQIANSIMTLKGVWDQLKDAPEEISCLIRELQLLHHVMLNLEQGHMQGHLRDVIIDSNVFRHSLDFCREAAKELTELVDALSRQLDRTARFHRHRASVKFVLKKDQIKRCKSRLKRAISLLSLSHQCYSR